VPGGRNFGGVPGVAAGRPRCPSGAATRARPGLAAEARRMQAAHGTRPGSAGGAAVPQRGASQVGPDRSSGGRRSQHHWVGSACVRRVVRQPQQRQQRQQRQQMGKTGKTGQNGLNDWTRANPSGSACGCRKCRRRSGRTSDGGGCRACPRARQRAGALGAGRRRAGREDPGASARPASLERLRFARLSGLRSSRGGAAGATDVTRWGAAGARASVEARHGSGRGGRDGQPAYRRTRIASRSIRGDRASRGRRP
jgi:hypothetical protein